MYRDNPAASIQFDKNGARGIALYNKHPLGRIIIGGSTNKADGTQVVISGEYELLTNSENIQVDYPKKGVKERVRSSIGYEYFLYVKRVSLDLRNGPMGYAFWLAE